MKEKEASSIGVCRAILAQRQRGTKTADRKFNTAVNSAKLSARRSDAADNELIKANAENQKTLKGATKKAVKAQKDKESKEYTLEKAKEAVTKAKEAEKEAAVALEKAEIEEAAQKDDGAASCTDDFETIEIPRTVTTDTEPKAEDLQDDGVMVHIDGVETAPEAEESPQSDDGILVPTAIQDTDGVETAPEGIVPLEDGEIPTPEPAGGVTSWIVGLFGF
jgi:hypothetical protein